MSKWGKQVKWSVSKENETQDIVNYKVGLRLNFVYDANLWNTNEVFVHAVIHEQRNHDEI